jgi:quercetin dioxygenase-like cupin family protein
MTSFHAVFFVAASVLAPMALAQTPSPILADSLRWVSPPNVAGLQLAWVLGAEQKPGAYVIRVKLAAGAKVPPHAHPDERYTTVLSGTILVRFSDRFDEAKSVAVPAGAVFVVPPNVPHYMWARDGEAVCQEAGVGPTGTSPVKK